MKILLLSNCNAAHTLKWAKSIKNRGNEIALFSIHSMRESLKKEYRDIKLFNLNISGDFESDNKSTYSKIIYLKGIRAIKRIIREFNPDILHAHYATSYGMIAVLSRFRPALLSVWGTDINSFPRESKLKEYILKFILSRADGLFATSNFLADDLRKYTTNEINIIPFGVDTGNFTPGSGTAGDRITVGMVKSLEDIYGVEILIRAFKTAADKFPDHNLFLKLVGGGSRENNYKNLVRESGLESRVIFTGYINPSEVPEYHRSFDIAVYPSLRESFGVAILESMAAGKAIIASRTGGIPEIVEHNRNGYLVEPGNIEELSGSIIRLIQDKELISKFGNESRKIVLEKYELEKCVDKMINYYKKYIR